VTEMPRAHRATRLDDVQWRKSSYSGSDACVAVAKLDDEIVAIRHSKHAEDGILTFTRAEIAAWLAGVKAGEFDDLC
jgi:hypothetical protein